MRAIIVVNPTATATTRKVRDILARALGREAKVELVETGGRGHATALAAAAAGGDVDLVVALGGDGTVNEVVNGLLADGPRPGLPMLAVVPGGSGNVFAGALGLPRDPIQATSEVLDALRAGRTRWVGLGRADTRWFTFAAGLGLDAEVVHRVESRRSKGRSASPGLYVSTAVSQFFSGTDRTDPALTLHRPGTAPVPGLYFGIVSNTSPWTYAGPFPVNPSPQATFETGLDLFAMSSMRLVPVLRQLGYAVRAGRADAAPRRPPRSRSGLHLHDERDLLFTASRPVELQVDGDWVGAVEAARFQAVPQALRVLC